jgi:hypothetical protein
MSEVLQHDPRTKKQIKDMLFAFLYEPVEKQFKQRLDALIIRNTLITGVSHQSFTYKGNLYNMDISPVPRKLTRLVPQLVPDMEAYLADLKQLNDKEIPYVVGFINQVLNASNDLHDYLRVFPQSLHQPIQKLIDSYPCRTKRLTDEEVREMQTRNQQYIDLVKQRMVTNLLI